MLSNVGVLLCAPSLSSTPPNKMDVAENALQNMVIFHKKDILQPNNGCTCCNSYLVATCVKL